MHNCAVGKGKAEPSFPDIVHSKKVIKLKKPVAENRINLKNLW